jgi:DNA polymerase elongation subunit (family B)
MSKKIKTNILLVDIENAPHKGLFWDGMFEQNILSVEEYGYPLSFSFKWLGEKRVYAYGLCDFKGSRASREAALLKTLHSLFDKADIIIAHNGDAFDIKKSNAYFIRNGLTPPAPYKSVDTLKVARKYFKFNSNRLNDLADYLGLGHKIQTGGFELWKACMRGEKKAWDLMIKYNKQDVVLLEKVYFKLRPWMMTHPNINALSGKPESCANCGSGNLQKRGFAVVGKNKKQRYQCQDCGVWRTAESIITLKK